MKAIYFFLCAGLILGISTPLQSASHQNKHSSASPAASSTRQAEVDEEEDEYDVMDRDQVDDSDVLAIPFDDSEFEDEEDVNRMEGRDVFNLPQSQN
jgi:hypothetical protein